MKRNIIVLGLLLAGVAFSISCEREDPNPEYPFVILVKTYNDSISVSNSQVEVFAPIPGNKSVVFKGWTDQDGRVKFLYEKEAVFIVRATRGGDPPSYIGCNTVRLRANEEVVQYVYLKEYDPEVKGC